MVDTLVGVRSGATTMRRSRGMGAFLSLAVLLLGNATVVRAEQFTVTTGVFGINCTSIGQICDPPATLAVGDPVKTLRVKKFVYDAAAAHCSAGRILIEVDGRRVGKMRFVVGSERATLRKRLRLAPGSHVFAFRFEGKVGGCNAGSVSGWGGEIAVLGRR